MYAVGELILYGRTGVCEVAEIRTEGGKRSYVLRPLYQTCCITIPADNPKIYTRALISREKALELLDGFCTLEAEPYYNRNLNQLRAHYLSCLEMPSCESMARFAKSLYLKREETAAQKKKFGAVDARFLQEAENLLFGEMAAVLNLTRDEVQKLFANRLAQA